MTECHFVDGAIDNIEPAKNNPKNNVGATAVFEGTVRADTIDKKKVIAIDFTTQKEIAQNLTEQLLNKYLAEYKLISVSVYHSVGIIEAGQTCFKVIVNSGHRKEAFAALPEIVNGFKASIPVFGKEILEDNTHVWKKNRE